jgi:hypothetical protein
MPWNINQTERPARPNQARASVALLPSRQERKHKPKARLRRNAAPGGLLFERAAAQKLWQGLFVTPRVAVPLRG